MGGSSFYLSLIREHASVCIYPLEYYCIVRTHKMFVGNTEKKSLKVKTHAFKLNKHNPRKKSSRNVDQC